MADGAVDGFACYGFAPVREMFEANLANGADIGASFCATKDGETVVDLWGGFADAARTRRWQKNTIVNVYSCTKTMTALCALMLADRGLLDFAAPVAKYWPQFAANGKAAITVAQVMSHTAGLSGWTEKVSDEDLYDWDKMTGLLAAQAPMWEPGTAPGYHSVTQGYLIGEIVRRITGRTLGTFFRQEVAEPLKADFHIGLPASQDARVANLILTPATVEPPEMSALQTNARTNPGVNVPHHGTRAWRGAEIPAAGGTGNARSIAEIHVILANGGMAQGKRFLSEAGCRKALELQIEGPDLILGLPLRYGMGFGLAGGVIPMPSPNCLYWMGYGGSLAVIDMDARTTVAYAMNRLSGSALGDTRGFGLATAAWQVFAQT
jgi:CubicO group peptidase (beta-lactamase class C family)